MVVILIRQNDQSLPSLGGQDALLLNDMQANLGGNPSRKAQVQAYLRMREKDAGPLDFDNPGGLETTWHRIFLCLRSAYKQEALEVCSQICSTKLHVR